MPSAHFSATNLPGTSPETLLQALLAVSLTGVALLQPVFADGDPELVDFRYTYLNPAAQRVLGLPERPQLSHRAAYPATAQTDTFTFLRDTFLSGQAGHYEALYQPAGPEKYFRLAAQRSGELLVLSFTDATVPDGSAVAAALRESQQREQAAHAEADRQHQQFANILEQAPAMICIFEGPQHRFQFVNPPYQALVGDRPLVGKPIAEAMPELAGQPIFGLLDHVYQTGETYHASEMLVQLDHQNKGVRELEKRYYNFIYQARHNGQGERTGIFVFAYDVTPQVLARQQVVVQEAHTNQLNEELAATNEELQAANEEISASNLELLTTQTELRYLNQELEARVASRTQALTAALHQTEAQRQTFYRIFEQTPAAVAILRGPDHRLDYFNPSYGRLFPTPLAWGRRLVELQPAAAKQDFLDLLNHVYQTGETYLGYEQPLAVAQADGQPARTMYFDFTYQPFQEEGKVVGISVFAYDVTERVLARQATERQRNVLNLLFMTAPSAICIYAGPALVYELVNPAYQLIFPGRELLGRPLLEALPELAGTPALASLRHVYQTGETLVTQEMPLPAARHPAGLPEDAFFTFTYQARRNAEDVIDGVLVFAFEVTDQVRARQLVEKSEQYMRRMADSVPAMLWLTDVDGQCIYLNQQWYNYTGQTEAEGRGMGWLSAVHPDDMPAASTIFLDASSRHASFSLLYRLRRHDGRYRWTIDSGQPRFSRTGEFDGFVGTVIDIHEQKQAEQALQRLTTNLRTARDQAQALNKELQTSNEQLRRTNADLDNFIYTASHDLKAPITNIEGLLHHLQNQLPATDPLTQEIAPLLTMMQESVERFQRTLEHLSDITKLQKEHDQPTTQVALADVVHDVQLDLRPLLEASKAQVEVSVDTCPTLSFSIKNLRSVVYNLLSNALKYRSPERPAQVRISCQAEGSYLVLRVQDNGLGLNAQQQAELFTMFRRFHVGIEGSGVGLYMVKKMVENAGGKLSVESTPGVGSVFSAYFRR